MSRGCKTYRFSKDVQICVPMLDANLIGSSGFGSGLRGLVKCKTVKNEQLLTSEVSRYCSRSRYLFEFSGKLFIDFTIIDKLVSEDRI